jgi:hypothetical protein
MNDHIAANCSTGVFIDFFGNRYHFEGQRRRPTSDLSKYAIRDLSTGEIEDGTSASGYSPNLGIFHALCVMRAPDTDSERALAGVEFTNGDQPGVTLKKAAKSQR